MKWAKYSGLLLLSFCLFFGLSPLKRVNAATYNVSEFNNIFIVGIPNTGSNMNSIDEYRLYVTSGNVFVSGNIPYLYVNQSGSFYIRLYGSSNLDAVLQYYETHKNDTLTNPSTYSQQEICRLGGYLNILKGSIENAPDFTIYPEPPPEPTWWDKVKEAFMDFVGSEALSDVLSGDWLSYIDDVLFGELWTVRVGEGEDEMIIPDTVSATPTPSPTPIPTPIPYSTVINPDTGEVTYHYTINVSGTPVPTSSIYPPVTSSPPGPGSGSTIDEPVAVEDYYEPEDSLSVPKLRIFKFLLRMTGNDVDVGMDSLDDNMAVMDATLEDNAEAISGVGDLFQLIPVKWFILIGTLACFPVIAAMIKSLLGG